MMHRTLVKHAVMLAAVSVSAVSVVRAQGMTFDMVSSMTMVPAMPGMPLFGMTVHGTVSSTGGYRMDIVSSADTIGPYRTGDYMLMSGGHILIVHPATKTYTDMMEFTAGMIKSMPTQSAVPGMSEPEVTGKVDTISTNEMIDGRSSLHTRLTVKMTRTMAGHSMPSTTVSDYWTAKLPIQVATPGSGASLMPDMGSAVGAMAKVMKDLVPSPSSGVTIKLVSTTSIDMSDFGAMAASIPSPVTTSTTEMRNVKVAPVDASLFMLPAGYTKAVK